jgi:hypothetical protein
LAIAGPGKDERHVEQVYKDSDKLIVNIIHPLPAVE